MDKEKNIIIQNKAYSEEDGSNDDLNNGFINSIYLNDSDNKNKNISRSNQSIRKDSSLTSVIQNNKIKKGSQDKENETDIMIQFNILKQ